MIQKEAVRLEAMTPPSVDKKVTFSPRGFGLVGALPDGTASVTVGAFEGTATLRAKAKVPAREAKAVAEGFTLERKYWLVSGDERKPIDASSATGPNRIAQGSVVYVELSPLRLAGRPGGLRRSATRSSLTPCPPGSRRRGGQGVPRRLTRAAACARVPEAAHVLGEAGRVLPRGAGVVGTGSGAHRRLRHARGLRGIVHCAAGHVQGHVLVEGARAHRVGGPHRRAVVGHAVIRLRRRRCPAGHDGVRPRS